MSTAPVTLADASVGAMSVLHTVVGIPLEDMPSSAAMQTRVDRKYIVPIDRFEELVHDFASTVRALEVDGRRVSQYESHYFDTDCLASYRAAAQSRPRRWKVRTRTYLDSGLCVLEAKLRSGRGATVKARTPYAASDRELLTPEGDRFLRDLIPIAAPQLDLRHTLRTRYRRGTLVDVDGGFRVTVDDDLELATVYAPPVMLGSGVVVETKSDGKPIPIDRWLWSHRLRPITLSKYGVGMAVSDHSLPSNKWTRTIRQHFSG